MAEGGGVTWIPPIGAEFAGYRLESLIGHGGMSLVYQAQHIRLGRTVALKLLSPQVSEDASFRERFERESQLAAALDHPNVIPIYEAGDEKGVFFIAMRYVEGADLKTRLKHDGPLGPDPARSLIAQVCAALDSAHAKGLIHRDVKPANILIAQGAGTDGEDHVYLSDFGVAKSTTSPGGLTKTGMFVGTAEYAAPEQFEGKELDGRADIYSIGCVLYESLTGARAYEKDSEVAMMYAHLLEPPPKATEKRPDLPREIDDVIAKAMAKSRDDRYATGRELAAAVRSALDPALTATAEPRPTADPTVVAAPAPSQPPGEEPREPAATDRPAATGRMGRRTLLTGVLAGAALAVAIVVPLVLVLADGDERAGDPAVASPPAAETATATTPPEEAEAPGSLLEVLIPTQIATTCTTLATPADGAVETNACTPPEGAPVAVADEYTLSFYADAESLERAYGQAKEGVEIGRCGSASGERVWIHPETGQRGGRRFCHVDGADFVIVWTHEKLDSDDHVDMLGIARKAGRAPTVFSSWWQAVKDNLGKCRPRVAEEDCFGTIQRITEA